MYNMTFTNLSNVDQNWIFNGHGDRDLPPNGHVDGTYNEDDQDDEIQIAISAGMRFAAVNLTYTAATHQWTIQTHTPNEFHLNVIGMNVGLGCLLTDAVDMEKSAFSLNQ